MTIRALSWNVNGLRAIVRHGDFLPFLETESPDILCLQEIKSLVEQLPPELRHVDGYHAYFNPAERKGYSGTAIYTKEEPVDVIYGLGIPEFDVEGPEVNVDTGTETVEVPTLDVDVDGPDDAAGEPVTGDE